MQNNTKYCDFNHNNGNGKYENTLKIPSVPWLKKASEILTQIQKQMEMVSGGKKTIPKKTLGKNALKQWRKIVAHFRHAGISIC